MLQKAESFKRANASKGRKMVKDSKGRQIQKGDRFKRATDSKGRQIQKGDRFKRPTDSKGRQIQKSDRFKSFTFESIASKVKTFEAIDRLKTFR